MPFFINRNFENQLFEYFASMQAWNNIRPINLGGVSNPSGTGGPPGGFIGQLPQNRVTYDYIEEATWNIPSSGVSLVNNLNRIRHRLDDLETGSGGGGSPLEVQWEGDTISAAITVINFEGDVEVEETSTGHVTVFITASGGGTGGGETYFNPFYWCIISGEKTTIYDGNFDDVDWTLVTQFPILRDGDATLYLWCDTASRDSNQMEIDYYISFMPSDNGDEYGNESGWRTVTLSGLPSYSDKIYLTGPTTVAKFDGIWFDSHHHVGNGTNDALVYGLIVDIE